MACCRSVGSRVRCSVQEACTVQIGFKRIPAASMEQLLEEGDVMWCAGGLMVEHPLVEPHITYMKCAALMLS